MAIVLNDSYQLISTIGLTYGEIRTYAKVNSQDNINNYTSYNLKMTYYLRQWIETSRWSANLDGSTTSGGYTRFNAGETTIIETSRTINHNNDGSSPTKNVYTGWSSGFGGSGESNVEIQMPKIDRIATITDVADFTDEENPVVYFTNPANMYVKAQLRYLSGNSFVSFGEVAGATSPCEIKITDARRTQMLKLLNGSTKYQLEVRLLSSLTSSSEVLGSSTRNVNISIIDSDPIVDLSIKETNQKVIDIYGSSSASTIVKNASLLTLESDVTLYKEATLKTRTYKFNGESRNADSLTNVIPESNDFRVEITDSRNLTAYDEVIPKIVDYIPVSIDSYRFERTESTSSEIQLNAEITYFQGTYNNVVNKPVIQYKLGSEGVLRTLLETEYSIDEESNKINIYNFVLQDTLVYTESERLYLYVSDLFTEDSENEVVTKGVPTFQAGETHFQVNGTLYVADEDGNNPINVESLVGGGGYDSLPVGSILNFDGDVVPFGYEKIDEEVGFIIESNSNENGSYVKYSNGDLICRGRTKMIRVEPGGAEQIVTLPSPFINVDYNIVLSYFDTTAYWAGVSMSYGSLATNNFIISFWNNDQYGNACEGTGISYIAIGKWK